MEKKRKKTTDPATGKPLPGGVTYRGPGAYQARRMVNGARFTETFASGALAKRWLAEKRASVDLGQFRDTRIEQNTSIRSLIETYRDRKMQNRESDRIGHIPYLLDSAIARLSVADWKPKDVREFRDGMEADGYAPATVVKRMNLLASVIQYAISELGITTVNYASGKVIQRPAGADKKRDRRLMPADREHNQSEEERLTQAVSDASFPEDVWLVRWGIESACRLSESLGLDWSDVDFDKRTIRIHVTKNEKHRKIRGAEIRPISPTAVQVLIDKLSGNEKPTHGRVFPGVSAKPFSMRFNRFTSRAGLADLTYHDLRHEATSRLARIITNPLDLMRFTGHRDIKSLNRYYQPDPSDLAKLFD